jgi:O-antigen/teichoic acid export membrane protein
MKKSFNFVFALSFPLMFGIIAISNAFVPLFFGKGYEKVPLLMILLSPIIVFISISSITGTQYLLSTKRQKEFTISVVIGALINFLFNLLLISKYKCYGAAIATVIAEFSVTLVQFIFVRKDFSIKEVLKLSKNYLIVGLIMFILCFAVSYFIDSNLKCLCVQVFVGFISYFGILLCIRDKFLLDIIQNNVLPIFKKVFKLKKKSE